MRVSREAKNYARARRLYREDHSTEPVLAHPSELGIRVIPLGGKSNGIVTLPGMYMEWVNALAEESTRRFLVSKECKFRAADPSVSNKLEATKLPELTKDIPEISRGEIQTIALRRTIDLPGIRELCDAILPQVEENLYSSYIYVEQAVVYRRLPSPTSPTGSLLWHTDNHHEGITKIMIYLTDVTEKDGPYDYLEHGATKQPIRIPASMPQHYPAGRVPKDVVESHLHNGYVERRVVGPRGTFLEFDDKIIHRGLPPESGLRDALVLQLRPASFKRESFLIPSLTTSF